MTAGVLLHLLHYLILLHYAFCHMYILFEQHLSVHKHTNERIQVLFLIQNSTLRISNSKIPMTPIGEAK